jgi:hypothetical protein
VIILESPAGLHLGVKALRAPNPLDDTPFEGGSVVCLRFTELSIKLREMIESVRGVKRL